MVFEDHCDQSNAVKCFAFDFWQGEQLQLRIDLLALLASEHAFSRDVFEMSNEIVIRKKREREGRETNISSTTRGSRFGESFVSASSCAHVFMLFIFSIGLSLRRMKKPASTIAPSALDGAFREGALARERQRVGGGR